VSHREIDVLFQGIPNSVCCHQIDGLLVDPGPESSVRNLFEALGDERPRGVLLTHIHLDHAGATGALIERWPDLPVWVHERGAKHVIDPSRLVASATRIYGEDQMAKLWGRIVPVPEENVRVLEGQGGLLEGPDGPIEGFRWAYTPGHAVHHAAYLHEPSGTAFTGDVAGVRIGDGPPIPPTPPPDIDVELWHRSIDLLESWKPKALAVTHFGTFHDAEEHLRTLRVNLDEIAEMARGVDAQTFEARMRERMEATGNTESYFAAMPPDTLYAGLSRYFEKRDTAQTT
jgi:glyoxylase-like metal-dependent hydrolase (beta-lactamase superfamily II)